jgi:hypothetical protein
MENTEQKTKEFQLSETELLKLENLELKRNQILQEFSKQVDLILIEFCKRVGQKKESLLTNLSGGIEISVDGKIKFKEE